MQYPGNNELRINRATLINMLEARLNADRIHQPRLRVLDAKLDCGNQVVVATITTEHEQRTEAPSTRADQNHHLP